MKAIIRQVPWEQTSIDGYFDGLENMYILASERGRKYGINAQGYQGIAGDAEELIYRFDDITAGYNTWDTYKNVMWDLDITYNAVKCGKLKKWAEKADAWSVTDITEYLTITTGKKWLADYANGYSQGDYVDIIYLEEAFTGSVRHYGEMYLGAFTEYSVTYLNDDGTEGNTEYGYIVAESDAWKPEDVKKLICEWAGLDETETSLETISGSNTYIDYEYERVA